MSWPARACVGGTGFLLGVAYWIGRSIEDNKGPLDRRFGAIMIVSVLVLPVLGWVTKGTSYTVAMIFLGVLGGSAAVIVPHHATLPLWPVWLWTAALLAFVHMLFFILGTLLPRRRGAAE
jgi:hypothetical protein